MIHLQQQFPPILAYFRDWLIGFKNALVAGGVESLLINPSWLKTDFANLARANIVTDFKEEDYRLLCSKIKEINQNREERESSAASSNIPTSTAVLPSFGTSMNRAGFFSSSASSSQLDLSSSTSNSLQSITTAPLSVMINRSTMPELNNSASQPTDNLYPDQSSIVEKIELPKGQTDLKNG